MRLAISPNIVVELSRRFGRIIRVGAPHNDKFHPNATMKKTLFAMLALATMLPAMAENWELNGVYVDPYEDILTPSEISTNPANYTLYLMWEEDTDLASVKTELEGMTFTEFTTTLASGDGIAFEYYDDGYCQICRDTPKATEFPTTLTPEDNIWGVCVYQHEDVVSFEVLTVLRRLSVDEIYFWAGAAPVSGYTTFSSVPEPATATLSLLALAGLATRRRRK